MFFRIKQKKLFDEHIYDLANKPLIDSDNFNDLLIEGKFAKFSQQAQNLFKEGYCLLNIENKNWMNIINDLKTELSELEEFKKIQKNVSKSIRFQDAWLHKKIKLVQRIAAEKEILDCLSVLYGRDPFPFQTLNFPYGSAQHIHTDDTHFSCIPKGYMCGVWVALEDVHQDSGPLVYFPKSHRSKYISAKTLNISSELIENAKYPQKYFEDYWKKLVIQKNYKKEVFLAKKGQVFIWHANLIHGGSEIINKDLTRWSQVTHYYFKNCAYTTPLYDSQNPINKSLKWRRPNNLLID